MHLNCDLIVYLQEASSEAKNFNRLDSLLDMFRNFFPDNIVTACTHLYTTQVTRENITVGNVTTEVEVIRNDPVEATNIMGE